MPLTARESDSAYYALWRKAKRLAWDPVDIDLTTDRAQWLRIRQEHVADRQAEQVLRLCSLFYQGEESVTRTLAPGKRMAECMPVCIATREIVLAFHTEKLASCCARVRASRTFIAANLLP